MIKYLSLLIVVAIATIILYCVALILFLFAICRGLFWDFKFQVEKEFTIRDFNVRFPASVWDDLHSYWYKPTKKGGC